MGPELRRSKRKNLRLAIEEFKAKHTCPFTGTDEKPYNVQTKASSEPSTKRPTEDAIVSALPTIAEYIETRKSPVICGAFDIVLLSKPKKKAKSEEVPDISSFEFNAILIHRLNGFVFPIKDIPHHSFPPSFIEVLKSIDAEIHDFYSVLTAYESKNLLNNSGIPPAILVDNKIIINADSEIANEYEMVGWPFPCLSFACLVRLILNKRSSDPLSLDTERQILSNLSVSVVDFIPETKNVPSDKIIEAWRKSKKKNGYKFDLRNFASAYKPPKIGFSLVDINGKPFWHRAATVVIKSLDQNVLNIVYHSYILGQDEGTYFGCELADHPNSVEGALVSLMPKEARNAKGVLRQGEWFAIPYRKAKKITETDENVLCWNFRDDLGDAEFVLPIDNPSSKHHRVSGEFIVYKDGRMFVRNFTVSHEDHADINGTCGTWYFFAKNTALQSVSAEGVD